MTVNEIHQLAAAIAGSAIAIMIASFIRDNSADY